MACENDQLHFVMLPLMSPGHFIPMLDMAKLLAKRRTKITIITSTIITSRFAPLVNRAQKSGLSLYIHSLPFPTSKAGLPDGCESMEVIPHNSLLANFFVAIDLLKEPFEQFLEEINPRPNCIISDKYIAWVAESARKFDVPRIIFDGMSCFNTFSHHNLYITKAYKSIGEWDRLVLPGLPDRIEMNRAHLIVPFPYSTTEIEKEFCEKIREAEEQAYGVLINTFDVLESKYIDGLKRVKNNKVWCVGPLSLCNEENSDKAERGNKAVIDEKECLKWLDEREAGSVVYACLGSLGRLTASQLVELGMGLELSKRPFVWVLRGGDKSKAIEKWIDEDGFEERTTGRGLIIRGWAPQVLILLHPAVGAFLTHCGWNSTLEGISAGIPLITWPMFAEQFLNERLVVEVLNIGVSIGNQQVVSLYKEDELGVSVGRENIAEAVERVLGDGTEGGERRAKARLLGEEAKWAMEEGGSSYLSMTLLIEEIKQLVSRKNHCL